MLKGNNFFKTNQRGVYELLSSFFFIIFIVIVILLMIYFSSTSSASYAKIASDSRYLVEANMIKDNILSCFGEINHEKVFFVEWNHCMNSKIRGYEISTNNFLRCRENDVKRVFGSFNNCKNKVPFSIPIINNNGYSCLGKLTLCFG